MYNTIISYLEKFSILHNNQSLAFTQSIQTLMLFSSGPIRYKDQ